MISNNIVDDDGRNSKRRTHRKSIINSRGTTIHSLKKTALISLIALSSLSPSAIAALTDRQVLTELFTITDGDEWERGYDTWADPIASICEWDGVTCDPDVAPEEKVLSLSLSKNGLKGTIPLTKILQMSSLRVLNLSDNDILFDIDIDGSLITDGTNQIVSKLRHINLDATSLYDIQALMGGSETGPKVLFPELLSLSVSGCELEGDFPPQFQQLSNSLEKIDISENDIEGELPDWLRTFGKIKSLNVESNELEGTIPIWLSELTSLEILNMGDNYFNGQLPGLLENLPNLAELRLMENDLEGPLLPFANSAKLQVLDLSMNDFTGGIPDNFLQSADEEQVFVVDLSLNELSGEVPLAPFENFYNETVFLADNKFTSINPGLCEAYLANDYGCNGVLCPPGTNNDYGYQTWDQECYACDLAEFYGTTECGGGGEDDEIEDDDGYSIDDSQIDVRSILIKLYKDTGGDSWENKDNWLSGESLCVWYGISCEDDNDEKSVKKISLNRNNLLGNLPEEVFTIPMIKVIHVAHNVKLTIPLDNIAKADRVQVIDFSGAHLIGDINLLGSLTKLRELDLFEVNYNGPFPASFLNLDYMEMLDLGNNRITGSLPDALGEMENLESLRLQNNEITGTIPASFAGLDYLYELDLSLNKMTGRIPGFLNDMEELAIIQLCCQENEGFTGKLPKLSKLYMEKLNVASNSLTGTIPKDFLRGVIPSDFTEGMLYNNKLNGTVPGDLRVPLVLHDNQFTSVEDKYCQTFPEYSQFGCKAVMCPIGTFNKGGLQRTASDICRSCPEAVYMGSTSCPTETDANDGSSNSNDVNLPKEEVNELLRTQRGILERFYIDTNGAEWYDKAGWMNEDDVCNWTGIGCNKNGVVTVIDLEDNNLHGDISGSIFDLTKLESFDVQNNDIAIDLTNIGNAPGLYEMFLSSTGINNLDGLENAVNLETLYLTDLDHIDKKFPKEVLALPKLVDFTLSSNDLGGKLPLFENQPKLQYLRLGENYFTGTIPNFNLPEMIELDLGSNALTGEIPENIKYNMPDLEYLDLSDNYSSEKEEGLSGTIPELRNMPNLYYVDLSTNQFTGSIPSTFMDDVVKRNEIELVEVSDNFLTGTVPNILTGAPLESLRFESNEITGIDEGMCARTTDNCDSILCRPGWFESAEGRNNDKITPPAICKPCPSSDYAFFGVKYCDSYDTNAPTYSPLARAPTDVNLGQKEILDLFFEATGGKQWTNRNNWENPNKSHCDRFGVICTDSASGAKIVTGLSLPDNNLVGKVPRELFHLQELANLNLAKNEILVDIQDGIGGRTDLRSVSLSGVRIGNWNDMTTVFRRVSSLKMGWTAMTHDIFVNQVLKLTNLEELDLSHNVLSGVVPDRLENLGKLQVLSLAQSRLTGAFPNAISELKNLETLDMSGNEITGTLPTGAFDRSSLVSIDVSHNQLTGSIPSMIPKEELVMLDLSGNKFSGSIPSDFLPNVETSKLQKLDLSSNQLVGTITQTFKYLIDEDNIIEGMEIIDLSQNLFESIEADVCGDLCKYLLCPVGTYNQWGRERGTTICQPCSTAKLLGSTDCPPEGLQPPVSSPTASFDSDGSDSERVILTTFFQNCDGAEWHHGETWLGDGSICDWTGVTCVPGTESVSELRLGSNNVFCDSPPQLLDLPNLQKLSLYGNKELTINFSRIATATRLEVLELDETAVTELVGLEKAPSLKRLSLSRCGLKGLFPEEITSLATLEYLNLAENELEGRLPESLSDKMPKLDTLILHHNRLDGELGSVAFPTTLRMLDLKGNQLNGPLPTNFLSHTAKIVDLSNNLLTGSISNSFMVADYLTIELGGNFFSDVDEEICKSRLNWNTGAVEKFGCNGLVCPKGFSAKFGRSTEHYGACVPCEDAEYMGSDKCYTPSAAVTMKSMAVTMLVMMASVFGTIW